MESKRLLYLGMAIGGILGGLVPSLWGASSFSFAAILGNAIGAMFGIWVMFRLTR